MMKFRLLLPAAFLLVLLTAACLPEPVILSENYLKDTSLITGDPCESPCWQNITPGETSWRDALTIIEDNANFTRIETAEDENSAARAVGWHDGDSDLLCCRMYTPDGSVVDAILLQFAPQMTLSQVLEAVGEPTYLIGESVAADQALMSLVYPDVPMVVYVFVAGAEQGALSPSSEIVGAMYMSAGNMQIALQDVGLYLWQGYGTFAEYIDGNFDVLPGQSIGETEDETEATAEAG